MRVRGFTIAELMAGLLFLTIAVFGLIAAYVMTLKAQVKDQSLYTATLVANTAMNRLEARLNANFDQSVAQPATVVPEHPQYKLAVAQQPGPDPDLTRVDVAVYWNDQQGPRHYDCWVYFARP